MLPLVPLRNDTLVILRALFLLVHAPKSQSVFNVFKGIALCKLFFFFLKKFPEAKKEKKRKCNNKKKKRELQFITVNYILCYILHLKFFECTFYTMNYDIYYTLHPDVKFMVNLD